jgi:hypothetical protein
MYHNLMMDNIDEVADVRLKVLKEIEKDKGRVAKQESQEQIISSERISVKNHTTNWIEEQQVRQVITKLERSLQSDQSDIR